MLNVFDLINKFNNARNQEKYFYNKKNQEIYIIRGITTMEK